MKKKVLAFLLASTMIIEPFTVASAADFSDGMGQDTVQFSDDAEDVPEVENDDVDQFSTDAVGEGEEPTETHVQIGDKVWVDFDDSTGTATISGTGDMWDYYENGKDFSNTHQNPFIGKTGIKKIVIENGVTSVGNLLLNQYNDKTSIEEVLLGEDIKRIGKSAFRSCSNIKNILLPTGLEEIDERIFYDCTNLESIEIPDSVKNLGDWCFAECNSLQKVKLPSGLKNIPYGAFYECGLNEIELPLNLESLGDIAFVSCPLKEITFPSSLKSMGSSVFEYCSLTKVNFAEGFSCNISASVFDSCKNLEEIVIPESVQEIRNNAFYYCSNLMKITIKGVATYIDSDAFRECPNIRIIKGHDCSYIKKYYDSLSKSQQKEIEFESLGEGSHQFTAEKVQIKKPTCTEKGIKAYRCEICGATKEEEELPAYDHNWNNGVITKQATKTEEGEIKYTCWKCNKTKTETIPKLSAIKFEYANFGWNFYDKGYVNCRTNKDVSYYITTVHKDALAPEYDKTCGIQLSQNCWIGTNILMPDDEVDIYIYATDTEGNYTYYKITPNYNNRPQKPSAKFKIGDNIIANINEDTITFIGNGAIYNMEDMYDWDEDDIWFQNGINKENIKHVIFKEDGGSITRIGNNLLDRFRNLEDVKLPEGLQEIGCGAFAGCNILNNIDLPDNINLIERDAFSGTNISKINWPEKANSISAGVFSVTKLKEFSVPEGVTEIDTQAFLECTELSKITIPRSVTRIGDEVFRNCRNLTIYGYKDSAAESYAKANTIKFVSADYSVVFKDNGRTQKTEYVTKGQNATPPTLSSKDGYTLSWDADYTNIQEDMVINAVWTKKDNGGGNTTIIVSPSETNKYTVTFKDRGKIVKTEKVKSGDAAEYPYINRNGYELSWDKDFSKVTANITVNAVWTVIKPNKVTSLTAEVQKNSIDLSWDRAENTDYYLVYRKTTSDTEYKQIKKTTKILWTDEDVEPGTEYSYKVVGVCSVDGKKYQGADSDIVTAKIGTPQVGDVYSVGDLKYKVTGAKEVSVIGLAKEEVEIKIPSAVSISGKAYKVTSVQEKAFYQNEDIVSIAIGNNVIYIGKYAFYQCPNLETVKFGKRVSVISTCAFTQCPNLENVILPSSIRRIGAKAFYQCTSIKVLKINGSALEYVGKKGLAVNKSVTLRLPKKVYTKYKKLIKASGVYSKTKFVKF